MIHDSSNGSGTASSSRQGRHLLATSAGLVAVAAALALGLPTVAASEEEHSHADPAVTQKAGAVTIANTCAPTVQDDLQRGVAMLHSFWFGAGEKAFNDVLAKDPGCALANWGIASLRMLNPLNGVGPTQRDADVAKAAIDRARQVRTCSPRELEYVDAVAAYYQDWGTHSERERQIARSKAYEALAARYPNDDEAQIFSALYIAATQAQSDQTFAAYARAAAILEKELAKTPDHPGIAHYLIHVYDAPPLAVGGLSAAQRYAGLAPDAPHALHMPSHIFTRVGAWENSAATNERSFEAAIRGNERSEGYHASDYAVYAYLQLGRDGAALSAINRAFEIKVTPPIAAAAYYSMAAMPARFSLERGDWSAAAQLTPPAAELPYTGAITWYARALGAARSGDVVDAEKDAAQLEVRHKKLVDSGNTYWATEVEVQQREIDGWIAFARKDVITGLKLMRAAAELEDRNEKHIVTPGRVLPARELLGDMLLEAGQPMMALKEYEASQVREPNRFRGYYGAARASEAAGDKGKAATYYGKLLELARNADSPRPELARARSFLASNIAAGK